MARALLDGACLRMCSRHLRRACKSQDNCRAHAWLQQLAGRKLYILCAPEDDACVRGMEPLDEAQRRRSGAHFFATVLQVWYRVCICVCCTCSALHSRVHALHMHMHCTAGRDTRRSGGLVALRGLAHAFNHAHVRTTFRPCLH